MAKFTRIEVALKMKESGIIPVFYHPDIEVCKQVIKACYDGGLRVFEYTNRGDYAHEIFIDLSRYVQKNYPDMALGAGTIIDSPTAGLFIQSGADFIVSPLLNAEMAKICNRRKVLWSPGCSSISEISYAEELGAEIVKIFPANHLGGPGFVKTIKGPSPWSSLMPSGGVEPSYENLSAWFKAGVYCVGMGSKLMTKEILANKDYKQLTDKVKECVTIIKDLSK